MLNLRLTRRIKFPPYWPDKGADSLRPKNRLTPTPYTFKNLSSSSHSFVATERLSGGPNRWSQVYAGSLSSLQSKKEDNLVLKVFDSALFPLGCDDPDPVFPGIDAPEPISKNSYRYTDELMAWAEVHAYSKLSSLQGTLIPYLVDAFMVKDPDSDKENMAIAISRIDGQHIDERCRELGSEVDGDTRWYPIGLKLARALYQIHKLGIIGIDIHDGNVMVVDGPTTAQSPSVKLFDFAFSRPNHFDNPVDMERHQVEAMTRYDIHHLYSITIGVCGGGWGRPEYLQENGLSTNYDGRRWEFFKWAREEHPNEPWVIAWWNNYFASLDPSLRRKPKV